jgi:hypothetical protein
MIKSHFSLDIYSPFFSSFCIEIWDPAFMFDCLTYHMAGTISPGIPQNIFHFMVVLSIMITIIMLEDKARAILHQFSHTVITSMELIRLDHDYRVLHLT